MTKRASLAAVAALTLGLGAVAAVLTVDDGVLLAKLPYRDPGRLVMLEGSFTEKGEAQPFPISQMDFADWRRRSTVFAQMSVFGSLGFNLEQGLRSRRLAGELVNAGYFDLLGLRPYLGRFFRPDEDARPFAAYVVVLGNDLWRSSFAGEAGVVGQALRLNGQAYTVVGVGPRGFRGLSDQADLWVPSMLPPIPDYLNVRRERWIGGAARLAPGVTVRQAQAQMDAITGTLAREFPNTDQGIGATVTPLAESWFGKLRHALFLLTAAAAGVLLLACCDVVLLLAKGQAAEPGSAAAAAAGPPPAGRRWPRRGRLATVGLALAAGVAGFLLARVATPVLIDASGVEVPSFVPRTPGALVALAVLILAALAGLACGLAPRRLSTRLRRAVLGVQVVLALVLGAAAAREALDYRRLMGRDLGFRRGDVLTFRMDLKGRRYMDNGVVSRLLRQQYLPRIAAVAGVQQAALCNPTMPTDGMVGGYITVEDHASTAPDGTYITIWHSVSPGYFETLGIPILAGRAFTSADTDSNVVIVSKSFAQQQWPGKNPLGRRIKQDARGVVTEPWMTVVGIAAEAHHEGIQSEGSPAPDIYMSLFQFPLRLPLTINFLVRPRPGVATASLRPALHRAMTTIDPELPDYDVSTLDNRLGKQTEDARFHLILLGLFGLLALLPAAAAAANGRLLRDRS
jgi:hypothetical protein